jgi:hypothetical protein
MFRSASRIESSSHTPTTPAETRVLFLNFPYVCPEPVLANIRFPVSNGAKRTYIPRTLKLQGLHDSCHNLLIREVRAAGVTRDEAEQQDRVRV